MMSMMMIENGSMVWKSANSVKKDPSIPFPKLFSSNQRASESSLKYENLSRVETQITGRRFFEDIIVNMPPDEDPEISDHRQPTEQSRQEIKSTVYRRIQLQTTGFLFNQSTTLTITIHN